MAVAPEGTLGYHALEETPVPDRSRDWFAQAERDLEHARSAQREGRHEWACFAAHQAAEKAPPEP